MPNSPSSYSSSLSFSPCPHRVLTVYIRVLTVCIPPPLKYVMLLWNMYCCSEMCIAALKYILPLRNMLSRRHAHVRKPSLYSTIWAPSHERVHNGLVPAHIILPSSYLVLTVCHRWFSLCATACTHQAKSLEYAQNFRRVPPAAIINGPPTCSPIAQRPAVYPHRVPPSARNLPHGGTR